MAGLIRAAAWKDTALGPVEAWPQSLKTAVDIVLGLPGPAAIWWGAQHVQIYNDAFISIARERHPALLGRPAAEGWSDVFAEIRPLLSSVLSGETVQLRDYVSELEGSDGFEERVFDADWSPLHDEAGEIAGALQVLTENTARRRSEAALRDSQQIQSAMLEVVPLGLAMVGKDRRVLLANSRWTQFAPTGRVPSADLERGWRWRRWDERGRPVDPERFPVARALRGEQVLPGMEFLYTDDRGREFWTNVASVPVRDEQGQVIAAVSIIDDVDEAKRAADALRASEQRQAFLLELSDALRPARQSRGNHRHGNKAARQIAWSQPCVLCLVARGRGLRRGPGRL